MGVARYVNIAFVVSGLLVWMVVGHFFSWALDLLGQTYNPMILGHNFRMADLLGMGVAVVATIIARRNEQASTFAMEVGNELSKVTWPTWNETKVATFIVIVITIVIAMILGAFDYVWAALSKLVYNV